MKPKENLPAKIDAQVIPVNERTILVKLTDARKLVKNYLATELPNAISAKYDEDRDLRQQVVGLTDFILEHFKTISLNEIRKAIDLNSAQALPENTGHYGRIDREFIGAVLRNYMTWRQNQRAINAPQQLPNKPKNYRNLLDEDLRKLQFYGDKQSITTDVNEKFTWLQEYDKEFKPTINTADPQYKEALAEIETKLKNGIVKNWGKKDAAEQLEYRLKAEAIKSYLLEVLKRQYEAGDPGKQTK